MAASHRLLGGGRYEHLLTDRAALEMLGFLATANCWRLPNDVAAIVLCGRAARLAITGAEERRLLALVLHDPFQPWAIRTHEHGCTPTGSAGTGSGTRQRPFPATGIYHPTG